MNKRGMGWVPDYPDVRDPKLKDVRDLRQRIQIAQKKLQLGDKTESLDNRVDQIANALSKLTSLLSQHLAEQSKTDEPSRRTLDALNKIDLPATDEIEREAASKISFLSACAESRVLCRGKWGKAVEELQKNLMKLGYYTQSDKRGYFGAATEESVRHFQREQKFSESGIVSPVVMAELIALTAIASDEEQKIYDSGYGPGILYFQYQLQALKKYPQVQITGQLDTSTRQAIETFQREHGDVPESPDDSRIEFGWIGPRTRQCLRQAVDSLSQDIKTDNPSQVSLSIPFERPISTRRLKLVTNILYAFLEAAYKDQNTLCYQLGGPQKILQYLRNTAPQFQTEPETQIKQRITPIVEVVARLVRAQLCNTSETIEDELKADDHAQLKQCIQDQYCRLQHIFEVAQVQSPTLSFQCDEKQLNDTFLRRLANWLETGDGYATSYPLQVNKIYQRGDSGPAIIYLQELLRALGYYNAPTTGVFEAVTEEAVKQFQIDQDITSDGIVALDTRGILDLHKQESFMLLEPTILPAMVETMVNELGGYTAILDICDITEQFQAISLTDNLSERDGLLKKLEQQLWTLKASLVPVKDSQDIINQIDKITNSKNKVENWQGTCDRLKQLTLSYAGLWFKPILQVVAQLIAPIGIHDDVDRAIADGLTQFRYIAQLTRLESIVEQLKIDNPTTTCALAATDLHNMDTEKRCKSLNIWYRRFQDFATAQQKQNQTSLLPDSRRIDEFKALVQEAVQTTVCSSLSSHNASLNQKLCRFLYQDLEEILEDFQQDLQEPEKTTELSIKRSRLDQLTDVILIRIQSLKREDVESAHATLGSISDRTFVRIAESSDILQMPVSGRLGKMIRKRQKVKKAQSFRSDVSLSSKLPSVRIYLGLPQFVDLSQWCSPVKDQGSLDSCTAHAGVALAEFFEKKSSGRYTELSSLFLYKVTRDLMRRKGDSGASVRETMRSLVLFGVPPEQHHPYQEDQFDIDPSAFCYAFAQNYQAISYFRLDDPSIQPDELLAQIKTVLAAGFPCMFGFSVYDALYSNVDAEGHISYPTRTSQREGGHAAIAVGYSDYKRIRNTETPGAFLIKNSWGEQWGHRGYGWLPYDYVLNGLAQDWWSVIKAEWVEKASFGLDINDFDWSDSGDKPRGND